MTVGNGGRSVHADHHFKASRDTGVRRGFKSEILNQQVLLSALCSLLTNSHQYTRPRPSRHRINWPRTFEDGVAGTTIRTGDFHREKGNEEAVFGCLFALCLPTGPSTVASKRLPLPSSISESTMSYNLVLWGRRPYVGHLLFLAVWLMILYYRVCRGQHVLPTPSGGTAQVNTKGKLRREGITQGFDRVARYFLLGSMERQWLKLS
ncbi:hypothetical protein DFH29DRAFT_1025732 [Suillus ampliporus]|nr:hypothetical protein DFH29DRAFT_1025732 [Suillus ampliporus]